MRTRLPVFVLLFSSVGWGLTWLPLKGLAAMGLISQQIILLGFGSGAALLLPVLWRQRRRWLPRPPLLAGIALAGGFAYVSFQTAITRGDTVRVMILFYLLPVWSVLGGRLFLGERLTAARSAAVALCVGGSALTLGGGGALTLGGLDAIDLLAIGSGLAFAANNLLFRGAAALPLASKVAAMYLGCTLQIALYCQWFAPLPALPGGFAVPLAIAYGAGFITLITFGTQWAVTRLEVGGSAVIIVMELVVAVASSALLTARTLEPLEILGCAMVVGAAVLEGSRAEASPPPLAACR